MAIAETTTKTRRAFLGSAAAVATAGAVMVPALASIHGRPDNEEAICRAWQDWRAACAAYRAAQDECDEADAQFLKMHEQPRVLYGYYRGEPTFEGQMPWDRERIPLYAGSEEELIRLAMLGPNFNGQNEARRDRWVAEFRSKADEYRRLRQEATGHLEARVDALAEEEGRAIEALLAACNSIVPAALAARLDLAFTFGGEDLDWANFLEDYPATFLCSILRDLLPELPAPMADYFRARFANRRVPNPHPELEGSVNA